VGAFALMYFSEAAVMLSLQTMALHAIKNALNCQPLTADGCAFENQLLSLCLVQQSCGACHADHGLYAHQTPTFDSYAASQDFPMHITEHSISSSYKIVGEVAGVLKMTGKDDNAKTKPLPGEKVSSASDITARLVFQGPAMVRWSRHDKQGSTNFISAFYLLPAGFGKTRFMSRYAASLANLLLIVGVAPESCVLRRVVILIEAL
jgi:hypothetical protein